MLLLNVIHVKKYLLGIEEDSIILYINSHCRLCGNIFCNNCANKRIQLGDNIVRLPQRVCDSCFIISKTINEYDD